MRWEFDSPWSHTSIRFLQKPAQCKSFVYAIILIRTRGEMDITTRFGRVIVGSSPAGCAKGENLDLSRFSTLCARRRHVFSVEKTAESGSGNFASDDEQNIPDHQILCYN